MTIKIELKLGEGNVLLANAQQVFNATLIISDNQGIIQELNTYLSSPIPSELLKFFNQLELTDNKLEFRSLVHISDTRLKKKTLNASSSTENINQLNEFKFHLNNWLNEGWFDENGNPAPKIKNTLAEYYSSYSQLKDEIQIIIRAENPNLQRLPWQEWDILNNYWQYRQAEVAISATDYRRPLQQKTAQIRATVRILAVFGDEKVGLGKDRSLIQKLKQFGGEIHLLNQPTKEELETALNDKEGWHIFFFAGHSRSDENLRLGWLEIKPGLELPIQDVKNLMEKAIQNKLQLAIFNSCDGLGLANLLTNLSLSYCIVMREPVESRVAQSFLKSFLDAFIQGKSLFASVHQARQHLCQEFDERRKQIGTSWLPVIVVNPLAKPLTWNSLFSEKRVDIKLEILLGLVAIIASIGLPLSILQEFGQETLIFYAQLYPHLIVYPSLFLWATLYSFYRVFCMTREKLKSFIILTGIIFIFSLAITYQELHSDYMMLFEFDKDAVTTVNVNLLKTLLETQHTFKEELFQIPRQVFEVDKAFNKEGALIFKKRKIEQSIKKYILFSHKITEKQKKAYKSLLRVSSTYEVWQNRNNQFSKSRHFYTFSFLAIVFGGFEIFTFIVYTLIRPNSVFNKNKHLIYLLACEAGILLWVPFHFYYSQYSKHFLFGTNKFNLLNLNLGVYLAVVVLTLLTIPLINEQVSKQYQRVLFFFWSLFLLLIAVVSINAEGIVGQVWGLNSVPATWKYGLFLFLIFFPTIRYLLDINIKEN